MEGGAYGAGKAGGAFDPYTLVRQPHTILRVVSWVRTQQGGLGRGYRSDLTWPGRPCRHKRIPAPATEFLSPISETSRLSLLCI